MTFSPPQPVKLNEAEEKLLTRIEAFDKLAHPPYEEWKSIADAMEALFDSLVERDAIPEIRWRLFTDSDLAETGSKSRQQVFESNGTSGREIIRHPHFIPYLRHFIIGPDLPTPAIEGLCRILNEDMGTSGELMDRYRAHARATVKMHRIDSHHVATEFFRLAIEIGMDAHAARVLRDAAMKAH